MNQNLIILSSGFRENALSLNKIHGLKHMDILPLMRFFCVSLRLGTDMEIEVYPGILAPIRMAADMQKHPSSACGNFQTICDFY